MNLTRIISGEMYYYIDGAYVGMRMEISLDHVIDADVLSRALNETVRVHPYLTWTVREEDGYFYFCESDRPAVLYTKDNAPAPGTADIGKQLVVFTYYDNKLCMEFFHGLMDGVASKRVMETLLYFYFSIRDGIDYKKDGIYSEIADEDAKIYAEPFETRPDAESANTDENTDPDIFRFSDHETCDNRSMIQRIKIPSDRFMDFVHTNNTSPSVMFSVLICHAIRKLYPDDRRAIKVNIPVNLRDALGCTDTFRNATGDTALYFDTAQLNEARIEEECRIFRMRLKDKLKTDNLKNMALKQMDFLSLTASMKGYKEKHDFYDSLPLPASDSVFISYIGKQNGDSYIRHVTDCALISGARDGIVFNITDCGGYFNITMIKKGSIEAFAKEFAKITLDLGIPSQVYDEEEFSLRYVPLRESIGLEE